MLEALSLGVFFALLQLDLPLSLGPLTVYHTELALLILSLLWLRRLWGAWLPAFAPLGLWLLAHAFGPGSPWEAAKGFLRAAEFALALALPSLLIHSRLQLRVVARSALFTGMLSCLWALAQSWAGPASSLNEGRGVEYVWGFQAAAAGMGHHNQFGAFCVAFLCLATACLWAGLERAWAWSAIALGLVALLCSYSRGAWAGAAFAGLLLFALAPKRARIIAFGSAGLALLLALCGPWHALRTRLLGLASDADRVRHLRAAWPLWEGHAWWGWGSAGLKEKIAQTAAALPMEPMARQSFSAHLHNIYLQEGLCWGAPVLFFWALFFIWPLRLGYKAKGPWCLALTAAMCAFFIQGVTDLLTLHARGMALAFCWGLLLAASNLEDARGA